MVTVGGPQDMSWNEICRACFTYHGKPPKILHIPVWVGTLTLLEEIRWAKAMGKRWLYPGYATEQPSAYDYKKSFRPLEFFDWNGSWLPLE